MAITEQLMDADAFLARPERPEGPVREELIEGRVVVNQPKPPHQLATIEIAHALKLWADAQDGRGVVFLPLALRISDLNVFAPDVLWYADLARVADDAPAQLAPPDLVVEVRSPSTWRYDVGVKRERYEEWGVRELWLVDDRPRSVLVSRRTAGSSAGFDETREVAGGEVLTSPALPGFELPIQTIFRLPGGHQK